MSTAIQSPVPAGAAAREPEPNAAGDRPRPESPGAPGAPVALTAPPAPAGGRNRAVFIGLAIATLALVGFGVRQYVFGLSHVSSDNAQVEGHVIPVLAKVSGYVTAVNVRENQVVREGELLVQLDQREYEAKLAQNEADLAAAVANAGSARGPGQADAQLAAARATAQQAQAAADRAHDELQRTRALSGRGIVSSQALSNAETAARSADAVLSAAQKQAQASASALTGAGAKAAAARATRDQSALNLSFTRIVAPASGVVSRKSVEVGQLVQAGQPTMTVVPLDDVWVTANLKETEIADVSPGDRAEIKVDAYHGRTFVGHVESLSPATGARFSLLPPDNSTGNFTKVVQRIPVRIRLDGAPDPAHPLRPGMSVEVVVRTK